jgi:hypothetical protein
LSLIRFRSSYLNLRYLYWHYLYLLRCTRRQLKDHFLYQSLIVFIEPDML